MMLRYLIQRQARLLKSAARPSPSILFCLDPAWPALQARLHPSTEDGGKPPHRFLSRTRPSCLTSRGPPPHPQALWVLFYRGKAVEKPLEPEPNKIPLLYPPALCCDAQIPCISLRSFFCSHPWFQLFPK